MGIMEAPQEIMTFPCEFHVKAMGKTAPDFEEHVAAIVRRHAPEFLESAVSSRSSSGGRFTSVNITIQATSRAQLEAIYQDFHQDARVLYVI